ncbi:hypothetical protein J4217_03155 [Candidatus Pacearchaeota archaeon]|nr:hypothetical protein [Candidatus Pacearchaeota archaeon]
MKKRAETSLSTITIFLDAFVSLLIIALSSTLLKTQFGTNVLIFALVVVFIVTLLRILNKW